MVSGVAIVKEKSVKHCGGMTFEMTLTDLEPDSIDELLALTGKPIIFKAKINDGRTIEEEKDQGKLFQTDNFGPAVPKETSQRTDVENDMPVSEEPAAEQTAPEEPSGIWICDKCGAQVGELENSEETQCRECKEGTMVFQEVPKVEAEPAEAAAETEQPVTEESQEEAAAEAVQPEIQEDSAGEEVTEETEEEARVEDELEPIENYRMAANE